MVSLWIMGYCSYSWLENRNFQPEGKFSSFWKKLVLIPDKKWKPWNFSHDKNSKLLSISFSPCLQKVKLTRAFQAGIFPWKILILCKGHFPSGWFSDRKVPKSSNCSALFFLWSNVLAWMKMSKESQQAPCSFPNWN